MSEKSRTIILLALLAVAIGFIIWTQGQYSSNFEQSF